jgi:hypothetical protein
MINTECFINYAVKNWLCIFFISKDTFFNRQIIESCCVNVYKQEVLLFSYWTEHDGPLGSTLATYSVK